MKLRMKYSWTRNILAALVFILLVGTISVISIPRRELYILPVHQQWPSDVLSAVDAFARLPPEDRGKEGWKIWCFLSSSGKIQIGRPVNYWLKRNCIVTPARVIKIFGKPSRTYNDAVFYDVKDSEGYNWSLVFQFQKRLLINISISSNRPDKTEE